MNPVIEQKSNDALVEAITAEGGVLKTSMEEEPIELFHMESPVDEQKPSVLVSVSDCNGDLQGKSSSDVSSIVSAGEISFAADVHKDINNSNLPSSTSNPAAASITNGLLVKDSVDSSQGGKSCDIVETNDSNARAFVITFGSFPLMLYNNKVNASDAGSGSGVSDTTAKTLSLSLDDAKTEIDTINSDNNSEGVSTLKSETNSSSDSTIVSEDVEEPVVDVQIFSSDAVANGGIQLGTSVDEVEKEVPPLNYLVRVPRYHDENLKDNIRLAQIRVDEKTRCRDAIRIEMQSMKATCKEYVNDFNAAVSQEKVARDLHQFKRQEIQSMQSVMDIDTKIRNMERAMQHETLSPRDENNFIRDVKQLKQTREKLSSSLGRRDEIQQGLDRKECLKHLQSLKKEADELRANLVKAEAITKAAKRRYYGGTKKFDELHTRFRAANDIEQEAYAQLRSLKKQSYEKHKHFYQYKDDLNRANDLALKGDKETLQSFCTNQVEKFMNLWNNNDEFRKEYVRCKARSTLRRLGTLDGRALIPNEKPPVIPRAVNERGAQALIVSDLTLEDQTQEKAEKANDKSGEKVVEQKTQTSKSAKPVTSILTSSVPTTASSTDKVEEAREIIAKRRKEEDDVARKAEEFRKEEETAKLREQCRLEEIAKAKEVLERKRRKADKAHAREAERALKEAEEKEKKREKRAKKKGRQKVAAETCDTGITDDAISAPTTSETPEESGNKDKPVAVKERPQKASQFTKHTTKSKPTPPVLRNRRKRRMQTWIRVLVTCLIIYALFLIGNCNLSLDYRQFFSS